MTSLIVAPTLFNPTLRLVCPVRELERQQVAFLLTRKHQVSLRLLLLSLAVAVV